MNWLDKLVEPEYEQEFLDHIQWFEDNLRIRTKQASIEPLVLNKIQRILEHHKWRCFSENKPAFSLILKARQAGCSTWAEATLFRDSREMSHRMSFVMAHKEDASRRIFEMTKRFLDNLPEPVETDKSSARSLKFKDTGSEFQVETAGSGGGAGRSFTAQGIHLSELDQYPEPGEVLAAIMPTLPDEGKIALICESTANGPMTTMNEMWDKAVAGKNEFEPFFFPWWSYDEYRRKVCVSDLKKYGPKDWVARRKDWLGRAERKGADGLARSRFTGHRRLSAGDSEGEQSPEGGPGLHRETTVTGGGSYPTASLGNEGIGGDDEISWLSPRGHLPSIPIQEGPPGDATEHGRGDDHGGAGGGSQNPVEGGELRKVRASDKNRREIHRKLGLDSINPGDYAGVPGKLKDLILSVDTMMIDSLTDYEIGLILEFDIDLDQINWLRYCLENKAQGNETARKREYPSRPEEAFEATGSDVLDSRVLAMWFRDAKAAPFTKKGAMKTRETRPGEISVAFDEENRSGKIEIYEVPDKHKRYILSIDPSQGIQGSDWTVGLVGDVDTGAQVAEFRATIDPDLAVDQLEALGIYYNKAKTIVEVNGGYGWPFLRHLLDRNTLPIYERMAFDRITRMLTKKPGWDTTLKTRPQIFTEMKEAVRKEHCKVRSVETLSEMRTLWENDQGKIEGRPGRHDDGVMAYGMFLIYRNQILGIRSLKEEEEEKRNSFVVALDKRFAKPKPGLAHVKSHSPVKIKHIRGSQFRQDGRRSAI